MTTPILDFLRGYAEGNAVRMHMPGHKGVAALGPEPFDLTEIHGADELYRARGIIRESEAQAAALFGAARTLYSAEGSSLCIRAMLYLALLRAKALGLPGRVLAGRNAHRTLISAAALLDLEIEWLMPAAEEGLLRCAVTPERLSERLAEGTYMAVYLTSPDYLGQRTDLRPLAAVCHARGIPLLVDNAHGAYLKFLPEDLHPLTQGADLCCDSAHKTLDCLTGAAYLHIAQGAQALWAEQAESALALFGSTSPSYLILASLDRMNRELSEGYPAALAETVRRLDALKDRLRRRGWKWVGNEPMKLTLAAKGNGTTGLRLAELLRKRGIECEFADPDFLTLMPSVRTGEADWRRLEEALEAIPFGKPVSPEPPPAVPRLPRAMSVREALLAPREEIPVREAAGRVLADAYMGCPPAVPIVVAGERMNEAAVRCLQYYGVESCAAAVERAENGNTKKL